VIRIAPPKAGSAPVVTFAVPDEGAPVSVVGDFNGWTPGVHPMVRRSNGTRSVAVTLGPGRFEFRYLADGGRWLDEPTVSERRGDNAVLVVG
jgi:hypothetical protein